MVGSIDLKLEPISDNTHLASIATSIHSLVNAVGYTPPTKEPNVRLLDALFAEAKASGVEYRDDTLAMKSLHVAFSVADLTSPDHPFEVQLHIAMYTWLSFLIDDRTDKMLADVQNFQERFHCGEAQPTPLLRAYAQKLRDTYKYYDKVVASFIVLSSLAFVNSCILETRPEYRAMRPVQGGENWAYYFREKEGICDAYAFFNFPKALCPDISAFLQAIPDIGVFINLGNDILSFYKEERAGETNNFIHKRARYEHKNPLTVLNEIVHEAVSAYSRASLALRNRGNSERAWHAYVRGYIAMHKSQSRYRLVEIGLDDSSITLSKRSKP